MRILAVVGAGIVGLAHAYAYAKRGWRVKVYERSQRAMGASVRNFGMIWPIGQPAGEMAEMASLSRRLWLEVLDASGLPYSADGSLHVGYHADEEAVAREFAAREPERATWVTSGKVLELSPAARGDGLRGALFSKSEVVVDPRLALATIPEFLDERYGVEFHWQTAVNCARTLGADRVIICGGDDFETLYPGVLQEGGMTRCKLQMLRTAPQPAGWRLGPALAGGLTLRFYAAFRACESLKALEDRVRESMADYERWGIHVMASQTADGAITLGDSHEYGLAVDLFNKEEIDRLILTYLNSFAEFPRTEIAQRWHGVYAKHFEKPYCVFDPEPGVRAVTGLGGAGMTLSFGLAETLYED